MKIRPAIDTSAVSSIEVMPPKLVLDRRTEQHEADANGEPLSSIEEVCIGAGGRRDPECRVPRHSLGRDPPGHGGEGGGVDDLRLEHRRPFGLTFRAGVGALFAHTETGHQARQSCATGLSR
ncbi:MAG: hypothetical protein QOH66_1280 [Actinomycetota bacterium]|nr:hypothetical protein [Actinomycetota bacterium]